MSISRLEALLIGLSIVITPEMAKYSSAVSRWMSVAEIAAAGLKTHLQELGKMG